MRTHNRAIWGILIAVLLLAIPIAVAADAPVVTITVAKWASPPLAPTDFTITQTSTTSINITWTMGMASNTTIVRMSSSGYPWSIFDGTGIYSGNSTYVEVDDLNLSTTMYYIRAWSQNDYGTSEDYAQASIGTASTGSADVDELMAMIVGLIEGPTGIVNMMFAVALMGFAFWKKGWLRVMMGVSLIIWGAFMMSYDMKIAAPFIAVGFILFVKAILKLIAEYRRDREEVRWAN